MRAHLIILTLGLVGILGSNHAKAQPIENELRQGDNLALVLSGEVAKSFYELTHGKKAENSDHQIVVYTHSFTINGDGTIEIEHVSPSKHQGSGERLVTIDAKFKLDEVKRIHTSQSIVPDEDLETGETLPRLPGKSSLIVDRNAFSISLPSSGTRIRCWSLTEKQSNAR